MKTRINMSIGIPEGIFNELGKIKARLGISKANLIRLALNNLVNQFRNEAK